MKILPKQKKKKEGKKEEKKRKSYERIPFPSLFLLLLLLSADLAKLAISQRLRENPIVNKTLGVPLGRALRLPSPEDPAFSLTLERLELGLDIPVHVVAQRLAPGVDVVPVLAGANVGGVRVGAVVAGADAVAVQGRRAVGHGGGPFADDGPFVRAGVDARVVADVLPVLPGLHGDELVGEALVLVVVEGDPLGVVVGGR